MRDLGEIGHTKIRRIQTERRTPIPANMTLAGENTFQKNMRLQILVRLCPEAYQTNTRCNRRRESVDDVDGWIEPS
jgi:hypothetical protein